MGVKCLAQEHNAMPRPGLEPGTSDPESSALTIRPPRLPLYILSLSITRYKGVGGSVAIDKSEQKVTEGMHFRSTSYYRLL